jgi:hypothetical protein
MKVCLGCSQVNADDDRFCSRCGRRLVVWGSAPNVETEEESSPSQQTSSFEWEIPRPPPPRGRHIGRLIAVGAMIVVAAVLATFLLTRHSSPIHFPNTIAGEPEIDSPQINEAVREMTDKASVAGHHPQAAFYGTENTPVMIIVAYDTPQTDVDSYFVGAVNGFESTAHASVAINSKETGSQRSATYECAPYTSPSSSGDLCTWADRRTSGIAVLLGGPATVADPIDQMGIIHDAVVG